MFNFQCHLELGEIAERIFVPRLVGRDVLIRIYLPYCIRVEENESGKRILILNREYRALGVYDYWGYDRPNLRKPHTITLYPDEYISYEESQWFNGAGIENARFFVERTYLYTNQNSRDCLGSPGSANVARYRKRLNLLSEFIEHQPVGVWTSDRCPLLI